MSNNIHPKIGIVSGVGPLAGSDVLASVFKYTAQHYGAVEDTDYPDLILISKGIEGIGNTATMSDSFRTGIQNSVTSLEMYGANIIGIACNTAHAYLDSLTITPGVKMVNLIEAVATQSATIHQTCLLLTSSGAKQQKLYQHYLDSKNVKYVETTYKQQKLVDSVIALVMAHKLPQAGARMQKIFEQAKKSGIDTIIAGCTELPLAIKHCPDTFGVEVINSNDELAKALVKEYYAAILTNVS